MFQHRHLVVLAAALREAKPDSDSSGQGGWQRAVNFICDAVAATNPRIDRARFLRAVNGEPDSRDR